MQQSGVSNKALNENVTLKAYEKKVKEDVRLMHENLYEMLKLLKMEDDKVLKVRNINYILKIRNWYY